MVFTPYFDRRQLEFGDEIPHKNIRFVFFFFFKTARNTCFEDPCRRGTRWRKFRVTKSPHLAHLCPKQSHVGLQLYWIMGIGPHLYFKNNMCFYWLWKSGVRTPFQRVIYCYAWPHIKIYAWPCINFYARARIKKQMFGHERANSVREVLFVSR